MLLLLQELQSIVGGGHVGDLDVVLHAGLSDLLGPVHVDVVLSGSGHVDVHVLDAPALGVGNELTVKALSIRLAVHGILSTHLEDVVQLLVGAHAIGIVDVAVGAGKVGDLGAQLSSLLHDAPAHVAVAGHSDALTLDGLAVVSQSLDQIVHSTEASGLRTHDGAAGGNSLAGQSAELSSANNAAILAVHIADFTAAAAQVASGAVDVLTNVAIQLGDEGLAETHDLGIALAARIEVRAALGAADGQTSHGVLKDLLKAQELDDGEVHGRIEADASLIGAEGRVVLNAVAAVDVPSMVVVLPSDAELDHALGLDHTLQKSGLFILGVGGDHGLQRAQDLLDSLQELRLVGILGLGLSQNSLDVLIHDDIPPTLYFCGDLLKN